MSPIIVGIVSFMVLFGLLIIGLPIGFGIGLVGVTGFWYLMSGPAAIVKLGTTVFSVVSSYDYAVLVLFLFSANVLFAAGIGRDLYDLAAKWMGQLRGGLAIATIVACAVFAAASASAVATAVTIGLVALPEMKRYMYSPALASGALAMGGPLGILIPPSNMFILYGIMTGTSIGKLFVGGIVPGVITTLFYMITIYILCWRNPNLGPQGPSYSLREKIKAFKSSVEILGVIVLVLGGLMIGWFTPTEAGAVAAFGSILFSLIRRRLNWQKFKQAAIDTLKVTGMLFAILIGVSVFLPFMAVTTLPTALANFVSGLPLPPMLIMVSIIGMYFLLGTFMEELSMMLITIPILFPVVVALGFDPIWFGIIITRMIMIAGVSPPMGLVLFTILGLDPDLSVGTLFKGVIPFLIADVFNVVLLLFVPALTLFLPSIMR
jgi:C4-dicarboxylate transporter DctM subunit